MRNRGLYVLFLIVLGMAPLCAQAAETVGMNAGVTSPPNSHGAPKWVRSAKAELFNNGPFVTTVGGGPGGADGSLLNAAAGLNTLGFGCQVASGNRVADDFTVPAGGWTQVDTITFFSYQTGSTTTSTINHVNVQIWNGRPGDAGATVVWGDTTTNRLASSAWTNCYRYSDTTPGSTRPIMSVVATINTSLPAGTYWVDYQIGGTLSSGPWAVPITIAGQTTTGNGRQYTTAWADLVDTGTAATVQGLPFIINGTTAPIPTLDAWGLIALLALVAGVGSLVVRRLAA